MSGSETPVLYLGMMFLVLFPVSLEPLCQLPHVTQTTSHSHRLPGAKAGEAVPLCGCRSLRGVLGPPDAPWTTPHAASATSFLWVLPSRTEDPHEGTCSPARQIHIQLPDPTLTKPHRGAWSSGALVCPSLRQRVHWKLWTSFLPRHLYCSCGTLSLPYF